MARVFWDSNLFIYLFEGNPQWSPRVAELRRGMLARKDQLLTSWFTVGEVLTKPKETKNQMIEKSYLNFFVHGPVELISFDSEAAKRYAEIRSRNAVRSADAIQLACAAASGTDLFLTTDVRLSRLAVAGITFITTPDRAPY